MATFEDYSTAVANSPILASAWNQNIAANQDRFQNHEHNGDGDNGLKIGSSGLTLEVTDILDSVAGHDDKITNLEDRLAALEEIVKRPVIVGFDPSTPVHEGDSVDILGENFDPVPENNIVTFSDGVLATVTAVDITSTPNRISVTVPSRAVPGRVTVGIIGAISPDEITILP